MGGPRRWFGYNPHYSIKLGWHENEEKETKGQGEEEGGAEERRGEETKPQRREGARARERERARVALSHCSLISKNPDDRLAHFGVTPVPSKVIFLEKL